LWARRWSGSQAQAYVQRAFERYWRDKLDIEKGPALSALLDDAGVPIEGFTAYALREGRAELERVQSELINAGIFEVPTYLLNDEIYVGRQHLPLIRSLLIRGNG
jgi:2-hydroxychromene-2-carboxylate isomerase